MNFAVSYQILRLGPKAENTVQQTIYIYIYLSS